jgi:nitroreductase/NAD-dependent dihydropyrimidine dehydrogenase PreA subunit
MAEGHMSPTGLRFAVDPERCTRCESCVVDCPSSIIRRQGDAVPSVAPEDEKNCILCQHCLAVCPEAAISIAGLRPENSRPITALPGLDQLDLLVRARRSVRQYREANVDPALIDRLLEATAHAPTGVNVRKLTFTVVQDRAVLHRLRDQLMQGLAEAAAANQVPAEAQRVSRIVLSRWKAGRDVVFRGAPHALFISSPPDTPCAQQDVVLALAYFELLAQSAGLGTVWCGYAHRLLDALPASKAQFQVPEGHIYYAMLFGHPAVHYPRTVQRQGTATICKVS